ncbi:MULTISPECIES: phage portal protein [unclassified Clostridium]|uniref:phage portal protein n=1 Tax=unclassified Clostridium TaxID=2614128 RepID=UPI0021AB5D22|nr:MULTISPECIES: phage portal protein [unclassified Clostridium]
MGFIRKIFGRRDSKEIQSEKSRVEVMNGGPAIFTQFSGNAYESDIYRSAVDSIARNVAKLKPVHVVTIDRNRKDGDNSLNRILQVRPNPYMTSYDMIYKIVTHYYLYNNAFAYLQKDENGKLTGIYPLSPVNMEYLTDLTGELYCRFFFIGDKQVTLPFRDVFTIRRFYNSNDLLGDKNTAILNTLDLAHTQNEGIANSIKSSATIKGLLKYNQILSPENLKKEKEEFIKDYLSISNNGGIAALDSKMDYVPLEIKGTVIDSDQLLAIKQKIYDYLGVSEKIVNSTYNEDEWSAFYESVIEALGVQISLELTDKIFTQREQAFGNSIIMEANRLQFASNTTKVNMLKELMPLGLFTVNQALEILNLPSVEDGDRRVQTLNVANTKIVDEYQMNKKGVNNEGNKKYPNTEQ